VTYNYSDHAVFALVGITHFPVEITAPGPQPPNPPNLSLVCGKCYNAWPCQTILDYRAYALANQIPTATQSPLQPGFQDFQNTGKLVPGRST